MHSEFKPRKLELTEIKVNSQYSQLESVSIHTKNQTYGRRFDIIAGNGQREVVFHDLFKTAQRLVNEAKNFDDFQQVKEFIKKLNEVNQIADIECKARCQTDPWYRILNFFSRIGNIFHGFGSHSERLKTLEQQLQTKNDTYQNKLRQLKQAYSEGTLALEGKYELALACYSKQSPEFVQLMEESADGGYLPAQKYLGERYIYREEDTEKGYKYHAMAAEQGDMHSAFKLLRYNVGDIRIENNTLSPKNKAEALNYCKIVEDLLKSYSRSDKEWFTENFERLRKRATSLPDESNNPE